VGLAGGLNAYAYIDGNPVGYVDPLGLLPDLPKSDGQKSFYSVQSKGRIEQLLGGGEPWPNKPTEVHFGEGLYTWSSLDDAENYLTWLKKRPWVDDTELNIIEVNISRTNYNDFHTMDLRKLFDDAQDDWLSKYSALGNALPELHGYDHIIRGAGIGDEFFFFKKYFLYFIDEKSMKHSSKFLKHKNGRCSYACIEIEAIEYNDESITWANIPYVGFYKKEYGDYINSGILHAYSKHVEAGGKTASFIISNLIESVSDTDFFAMKCAAISATWQALGHSEKQIEFIYNKSWDAIINTESLMD